MAAQRLFAVVSQAHLNAEAWTLIIIPEFSLFVWLCCYGTGENFMRYNERFSRGMLYEDFERSNAEIYYRSFGFNRVSFLLPNSF